MDTNTSSDPRFQIIASLNNFYSEGVLDKY